jgi:Glycosyltransferase family 87
MTRRMREMIAIAFLAGTLLIHGFLFWRERPLIAKGYPDFTIFYSAGLMLRQGLGHQLYDEGAQYRIQRGFASGIEARQRALPYNHPPFEALIFAPLTFLPFPVAYATWGVLNIGILALLARVLRSNIEMLRQMPGIVVIFGLFAFFPIFFALIEGQDAILLLLLLALAFAAVKRDSDLLSGCWLGLGSFKLQLVLPLAMILLGWKRPKVFQGFIAACLCLAVISVVLVGWPQAMRYPYLLLHLERAERGTAITPFNMPNLRGLLEGWSPSGAFPNTVRDALVALSLGLLFWVILGSRKYLWEQIDLPFALAVTASVLISYHGFAYDLTLLAISLLIVLNSLLETGVQWPRDFPLLFAGGLLLLTPLYLLLLLRLRHLNLLALVLLLLLFGIHQRIKAGFWNRRADRADG